jgi:formate hydrogenlyase subunit 3/multisubunit Na+/H+ antiporter MnhD subunit
MIEMLFEPLVMPVALPLIAGALCLALRGKLSGITPWISLLASAATVALVWPLFTAKQGLFDVWPISLSVDVLSGLMALAIAASGLLISIYSLGYMRGHARLAEYNAYLLLTVGASLGAVMANELILLLVFWGFLGFTLYMMIGISGSGASSAAKKAFIIIGGSDCLLILGIAIYYAMTGSTSMDARTITLHGALPITAFLCFVSAAFAKAGAMPLHTWVPDCGEKAPAPAVALLPAMLDKILGIYLLMRICGTLFAMSWSANTFLMIMGAGTILFAVMMALVQHNMKRLLSYHAVSQVGYMVLGIGTGTALGIAGGLFHLLNNVLYKSCLFLCAGSVEKKAGTADIDKLGGMAATMPITFAAFLIAALSISGVPPFNGFASKWMIYQGLVLHGQTSGGFVWAVCLAAAMLGSALTLASFVKLLHAIFLRRPSPDLAGKKISEVGPAMWLVPALLALACVVFGVFAMRVPLTMLIAPVVPDFAGFLGTWWAMPATVLLLVSIGLGALLYLVGTVRKATVKPTYLFGENLDAAYVSNEPKAGEGRDIDVTGADFYRTIQTLPVIGTAYRLAEKKLFDIYDVGTKVIMYFVEALRRAHGGLLQMYLTWVMAGVLAVIAFIFTRGIR